MKKKNIIELLIFILFAELVGALSALLTGDFSQSYSVIVKPPLSPPGILFPIVWTILYALMGVSAFIIFKAKKPQMYKSAALKVYALQLFVNFLWSIIYFRFELLLLAAADIILLDVLVFVMIVRFFKIRPSAAFINIPYIIWLLFATYLNIATVILN